ncbi:MAG: hypothetical protein WA021_03095 [Minisyncoccia bacterium]
MRTGFRAPASEKGQEILAVIRELISHTRMLAVAGYISIQNGQAVAEALDELGSLIVASQRSALSEQLTVTREDLIPRSREPLRETESRTARPHREPRKKEVPHVTGERPEQIMDILKFGGTLGIKDIAANVPQYSEKMVQRELAELVVSGKVQKLGSKRWSRYRVVS